jgi:hypothetical protein
MRCKFSVAQRPRADSGRSRTCWCATTPSARAQLLAKERERKILSAALAHDLVTVVMRRSGEPVAAQRATRMLLPREHRSPGVARLLAGYGSICALVLPRRADSRLLLGRERGGLRGNTLFARHDTPLHSILHEAAHYICMSPQRRAGLDRDAGGDDAEESAVCYLQLLLADALECIGRERLLHRYGCLGL